jgi:hypothetical protein
VLSLLALPLAVLAACTMTSPAPPARTVDAVRVAGGTITPEGASFHANGLDVLVPAGAVAEDVDVVVLTLRGLDTPDAASPVFRFSPTDLTFATDVELVIAFEGDPAHARVAWADGADGDTDATREDLAFRTATATFVNNEAHVPVRRFGTAYVAVDGTDPDTSR